jgi:hypothetical protein
MQFLPTTETRPPTGPNNGPGSHDLYTRNGNQRVVVIGEIRLAMACQAGIKEDHSRLGEIFRSMHVRPGHARLWHGTAIAPGFAFLRPPAERSVLVSLSIDSLRPGPG